MDGMDSQGMKEPADRRDKAEGRGLTDDTRGPPASRHWGQKEGQRQAEEQQPGEENLPRKGRGSGGTEGSTEKSGKRRREETLCVGHHGVMDQREGCVGGVLAPLSWMWLKK